MAKCKGCGREIIWIMSSAGKVIPCDPIPVPYWKRSKAKGKIVTPNGEVLSCEFDGDPQSATGIGYIPHWATCPKGMGGWWMRMRCAKSRGQLKTIREE